MRVGRGGPRWRDALGGSPVRVRVRDGRVHVTLWLVARPRQRLVPLTGAGARSPSAPRSCGCSASSSAASPSWWMVSGPDGRARASGTARTRIGSGAAGPAAGWRSPSVFEAEFGQRTADAILERHLALESDPEASALAREIVANVVAHRDTLDARITAAAPQYPVVQLARMDRALLRCGLCEVLHSPATPARVAIAEWVELARTYSGEPMRRLMNGVLGRVAREATQPDRDTPAPGGSQWPARTIG